MSNIIDGTGDNFSARVDANKQLHTKSVNLNSNEDATFKGNSFNVQSGTIGLTSTSDSAVLYFKNDESPVNGESDIIIDTMIVGYGKGDAGATQDEKAVVTVIRNPTAGTIISNASAATVVNRNFSSNVSLSSTTLAYKGAEGNTLTDGIDFGPFYQDSVRQPYPLNLVLGRGASIGVKINPQTSVGTTDVYVTLVCHRRDGKND